MSKLSSSKFCHSAQSSADALIVALLWKLPQMPSCSTNNANLDKTNFDMFYQIDCCAAIHGQIWMNNVPNWSRLIMLSCTEISFVISFFQFWKMWSQTRVSFYATQSSYLLKTWKRGIICRAVICYAIFMTNVSYERGIIVLSFPDISFVILLFVFQRFKIKSGFLFFLFTLYIKWNDIAYTMYINMFWFNWYCGKDKRRLRRP